MIYPTSRGVPGHPRKNKFCVLFIAQSTTWDIHSTRQGSDLTITDGSDAAIWTRMHRSYSRYRGDVSSGSSTRE